MVGIRGKGGVSEMGGGREGLKSAFIPNFCIYCCLRNKPNFNKLTFLFYRYVVIKINTNSLKQEQLKQLQIVVGEGAGQVRIGRSKYGWRKGVAGISGGRTGQIEMAMMRNKYWWGRGVAGIGGGWERVKKTVISQFFNFSKKN